MRGCSSFSTSVTSATRSSRNGSGTPEPETGGAGAASKLLDGASDGYLTFTRQKARGSAASHWSAQSRRCSGGQAMPEQRYEVCGELDFANAEELRRGLMSIVRRSHDDLVVDCDGLLFIDKSGVSVFASVFGLMARAHRGFRVVTLQGTPRRKIETLGLTKLFGVENADRPASC